MCVCIYIYIYIIIKHKIFIISNTNASDNTNSNNNHNPRLMPNISWGAPFLGPPIIISLSVFYFALFSEMIIHI